VSDLSLFKKKEKFREIWCIKTTRLNWSRAFRLVRSLDIHPKKNPLPINSLNVPRFFYIYSSSSLYNRPTNFLIMNNFWVILKKMRNVKLFGFLATICHHPYYWSSFFRKKAFVQKQNKIHLILIYMEEKKLN